MSLFTTALREDMDRLQLTPRMVGQRLGITQQAVDKWLQRGFPPRRKLPALLETLGPGSAVSALTSTQLFGVDDGTTQEAAPKVQHSTTAAPAAGTTSLAWGSVARSREAEVRAEAEFLAALPTRVRDDTMQQLQLGDGGNGTSPRVDFVTKSAVLEVVGVPAGGATPNLSMHILRLVAAAKLLERAPVLAVIGQAPGNSEALALAKTLDVRVWECQDGVALAAMLCDLEGVEPDFVQ